MICQETLENKKVTLRNITINDDLSRYLAWLSDESINQYLEVRFNLPCDVSELRQFVNSINKSSDSILFGIFDTKTDIHVGNIKMGPINSHHGVADLGLLIGDKSFWGFGYGSEAIGLVCDYAFNSLGLAKLTAGCYAENVGSMKAFLKQDFVQEGILSRQWLCDGKRQDGYLFGKTNPQL